MAPFDARNAVRMAEALRKRVESTNVAQAGAKNRDNVTIHVGVATIKPVQSLPSTELQKRSDAALYEASFQGWQSSRRVQTTKQAKT